MKMINKCFTRNVFFVFLSLLTVVNVEAMRISPKGKTQFEKEWARQQALKQEKQEKQAQEERRVKAEARQDFINDVKNLPYFKEFQQKLQSDKISKGWFKGPNGRWMNEIVILAFELLEPYKNRSKYASNFDRLHSYVLSEICNAIKAYDETCYLRIGDIGVVCKEISTKLDNLIEFSKSPEKVQPTFKSTYMFVPSRVLEGQALYNQLLEARKQRKSIIEED